MKSVLHSFAAIFLTSLSALTPVQLIQAQVPVINSVSPSTGPAGTTVTLTGENFSPIPSNNLVWFGAVTAPVTSAQSTQLVVNVPTFASQAPVKVAVNGLISVAPGPFIVTYPASPFSISSLASAASLPSGAAPSWIENADLDGDGKPDLAVANYTDHTISIYRNISTNGALTVGSFAARITFPVGPNPHRLNVGDIDGDGKPDVAVSHSGGASISIFRNVSTPGDFTTNSFEARVEIPTAPTPVHLALVDLNRDGKLDLAVANSGANSVSIFRNIGSPGSISTNSFAARVDFGTLNAPHGLDVADLDGDGMPDLAISSSTVSGISILRNTTTPGSATITLAGKVDFTTPTRTYNNLNIGDLDGDGKPDIAVPGFGGGAVTVFKNVSTPGTFAPGSLSPGFSLSIGGDPIAVLIVDIDGDGKSDLLATAGNAANRVAIFRNIGTNGVLVPGSFAPRINFASASNPHSLSVGDLDGDGKPDVIAAANFGNVLSLYRNINSPLPIITTQPQSRTAVAGTNVTLSVVATGAQPLLYQWLFDETNIVVGATNSSLVLSNVQPADSGNYSVLVTNLAGSTTSSNAVLAVFVSPAITAQPQDQSVLAGSNATFSVTATGTSLRYQWRFNGTNIVNSTNSSHSISNAQSTNVGGYSVVITNAVGSIASTVAALTIVVAPVIVTQPESRTAIVGSNVVLQVVASGGDAILPAVSSGTIKLWLKANAGVTADTSGKVSQWQDQSGNANHAAQANTNKQPLLVNNAVLSSGQPTIRFDGVRSTTTGDFLQGSGNLGLSDGFTSFLVCSEVGLQTDHQIPAMVGVPAQANAVRAYYINSPSPNQMNFAAWQNEYSSGFGVPTNAFRMWGFRLNSSKTLLDFYDADGTTNRSSSSAVSGLATPGAGYYVGAAGSSFTTYYFKGDISEVLYFQGSLSDVDRVAVAEYLRQKYFSGQAAGRLAYQWQLNGTNVLGATNASLTLTNVQLSDSGVYSVIVSNAAAFVISSNATLTVAVPPSIEIQPQDQTVRAGSNATFSVTATGTTLNYQWRFNEVPIVTATNQSFSILDVQQTNAGGYSVVITNPVGSVTSIIATLSITIAPTIVTQPQSQTVLAGSNFALQVVASGGEAALPAVNSGVLKFWLNAEAGVITDSDGKVSQWMDQSSNLNHAVQGNINKQPSFVNSAVPLSGRPAVRFDGIRSTTTGDFLQGVENVGLSNGFTSFLVCAEVGLQTDHQIPVMVGVPGQNNASRAYYINSPNPNQMNFVAWQNDYSSGFGVPTNGFHVWGLRLNSARTQIDFFDTDGSTHRSTSSAVGGLITPGAGYYVGAAGSSFSTYYFKGDISEIIYFQGTLSDSDRAAVEDYLKQKYFSSPGTGTLAYQWQLNGTDILGATNASLALTNAQPGQNGNYTVIVTNLSGSITSAPALVKIRYLFPVANGQRLTNSEATYIGSTTVSFQNYFTNGMVFYTLDGSTPSFASRKYTTPFVLGQSATLRAITYSADFLLSGESDPVNITVIPLYNLTRMTAGGGSIGINTNGPYLPNTVVGLTATPSNGWTFLQWLGDASGTNPMTSVSMTRHKSVRAVFGTSLGTTVAGNGAVFVNPDGDLYPFGSVVQLTAVPDAGSFFGVWGNAASGNTNPLDFVVITPNPVISSLFSTLSGGQFALTLSSDGFGRATASPRANSYVSGQMVTLTATPDADQTFLGWSGDASGTDNPIIVNMNQSRNITANFSRNPRLTLTFSPATVAFEGFQLTLNGVFGESYSLQKSSNLVDWATFVTVTNSFGTTQVSDLPSTNFNAQFYRATVP